MGQLQVDGHVLAGKIYSVASGRVYLNIPRRRLAAAP
jgi:hypothetical protein